MEHRHIHNGYEDSVEAIEDVLARGTVQDWIVLDARLKANPFGKTAMALDQTLQNIDLYGTVALWRNRLAKLRESVDPPCRSPRCL